MVPLLQTIKTYKLQENVLSKITSFCSFPPMRINNSQCNTFDLGLTFFIKEGD